MSTTSQGHVHDVSTAATDPRGRWDDDGGNSQLVPRADAGVARDRLADCGPHVGRGPRCDPRVSTAILVELCDVLTRHGGLDATDVDVTFHEGTVRLEGTVSDDDERALALHLVSRVEGVRSIDDRLTLREAVSR